jgi:EAL domain-containing protein (putative c-di-GMP-specific phosphodiesterase class I)
MDLVREVDRDPYHAVIVSKLLELSIDLGVAVVAEGVETAGQLALLAGMDCRFLQGWLLGRPVPGTDVAATVDSFDPVVLDAVPRTHSSVSTGWDALVDGVRA